MSEAHEDGGRARQRRRTRAAIVNAAAELIQRGHSSPGVNEIAQAADVSRRTIYQYFPTLDQLLLDATVGLLSEGAVDAAIESADPREADANQRVAAMISALGGLAADTLPLGRSLIRLTVDAPGGRAAQPKRGYRRIRWIERAVQPLREGFDPDLSERLVSALAMVVGWEALIVLSDLRGLPPQEQVRTSTWAAQALIRAALDEQATRDHGTD